MVGESRRTLRCLRDSGGGRHHLLTQREHAIPQLANPSVEVSSIVIVVIFSSVFLLPLPFLATGLLQPTTFLLTAATVSCASRLQLRKKLLIGDGFVLKLARDPVVVVILLDVGSVANDHTSAIAHFNICHPTIIAGGSTLAIVPPP